VGAWRERGAWGGGGGGHSTGAQRAVGGCAPSDGVARHKAVPPAAAAQALAQPAHRPCMHACQLHCTARRFQGRRLLLRSSQPVGADQQLTLCYGPQAGQTSTPRRQALLRQQYGFTCACGACSAPDAASEAEAAGLQCSRPGCAGEWRGSSGSAGGGSCSACTVPLLPWLHTNPPPPPPAPLCI
jgi:hypothetical protein